jgi:hypothetical protein
MTKIRHPFEWLSPSAQNRAFVVLFVLTVAVMVILNVLGVPMKTEQAPGGIISFEFARELAVARGMVQSWGETGRVYAGLNLGLDYLFLFCYSSAIGLGCVLVARGLSGWIEVLAVVGLPLSWAQFVAALLDAVENYALIQVLLGSGQASWPVVAWWCAVPKFIIVAAGLVYVIVGALAATIVKGLRAGRHTA